MPEKKGEEKHKINFFIPTVVIVVLTVLGILISINKTEKTPSPEEVNELLSQPFSATANIKFGKLAATAKLGKSSDRAMSFVVSEPPILSGLEFSFDGNSVTASYKGLKLKLDDDSLLAKSAAAVAINAINTAAEDSGVEVETDGNALLVHGENDDGKFTLRLDKKTGALLNLSVPNIDFECNFN